MKEKIMTKNSDGLEFNDEEISDAVSLNNSFAQAGKKYKKVYGIDGISRHQAEIDRLLLEGWEIVSKAEDRILLGCNNVVDVHLDADGFLRFEYGSNSLA